MGATDLYFKKYICIKNEKNKHSISTKNDAFHQSILLITPNNCIQQTTLMCNLSFIELVIKMIASCMLICGENPTISDDMRSSINNCVKSIHITLEFGVCSKLILLI